MDANSALQYGDAGTAALSGTPASVAAANKNLGSVLNQETAAMEPAIARYKGIAEKPLPTPPEPKKAPPAPDEQDFAKASQGWVQALAVMSALIGARGRAHGTGALKAFAAGMNGIQQGNQQAFKDAYTKWDADTKAMQKENDEEMAKYKAVIDNRELSEQEAANELKLIGYEYQNKVMMATTTAQQAFAVYDSIVKARTSMDQYVAKLKAKADEQERQQDEMMQRYENDPGMQALAKAYAKGVPVSQLVKGWGAESRAQAQAIQDIATRNNPDLDWATEHNKYLAEGSRLRTIGTQSGRIQLGSEMLNQSLPSMMDAAQKVGLSASTDLNDVYNTVKRHMSDQDFQNFSTQLRAVTSDYSVFIGRGRLTVHSDQEALKILHDNMGITSLKGFEDAVRAEQKNTAAAIDNLLGPGASPAGASENTKTINGVTYKKDANGDWYAE